MAAGNINNPTSKKMLNIFKNLGMILSLEDKSNQEEYVKDLLNHSSNGQNFDYQHCFKVITGEKLDYDHLSSLLPPEWQRLAQMVAYDIIRNVKFTSDVTSYNIIFQFGPDITFTRSIEKLADQSDYSTRDQLYKIALKEIDILIKIKIDNPEIFRFYQQCQDLGLIQDVCMQIHKNGKYDIFSESILVNHHPIWEPYIYRGHILIKSTWSIEYFKSSHCHIHDIMLYSGYKAVHEIEKIVRSGQKITVRKIDGVTFEINSSNSSQKYDIVLPKHYSGDVYTFLTEHLLTQFPTSPPVKKNKKSGGNITIPIEYKPYGNESVRILQCDTDKKIIGIYLIANYDPNTMYIDDSSGIHEIYSRHGAGFSLDLKPIYVFEVSALTSRWYRAAYKLGKRIVEGKKYMIVTNRSYPEHCREAERMLETILYFK